MTKKIPSGFHTLTPVLTCTDATKAIKFYADAFGAEPVVVKKGAVEPYKDKVMHAQLRVGDSFFMLHDSCPQNKSPAELNGTPVGLWLYVENADALYDRAVKAGCTVTMAMQDAFWGDRWGVVTDPFGHQWNIATHQEDLTAEEIDKRAAKAFAHKSA